VARVQRWNGPAGFVAVSKEPVSGWVIACIVIAAVAYAVGAVGMFLLLRPARAYGLPNAKTLWDEYRLNCDLRFVNRASATLRDQSRRT
jgi:hypothetical protein